MPQLPLLVVPSCSLLVCFLHQLPLLLLDNNTFISFLNLMQWATRLPDNHSSLLFFLFH